MGVGELGSLRSIFTVSQKRKLLRLRIGGLQENLAVIELGEEPRVLGGGDEAGELVLGDSKRKLRHCGLGRKGLEPLWASRSCGIPIWMYDIFQEQRYILKIYYTLVNIYFHILYL